MVPITSVTAHSLSTQTTTTATIRGQLFSISMQQLLSNAVTQHNDDTNTSTSLLDPYYVSALQAHYWITGMGRQGWGYKDKKTHILAWFTEYPLNLVIHQLRPGNGGKMIVCKLQNDRKLHCPLPYLLNLLTITNQRAMTYLITY